jgi:glycosyltransferase involved in cell wall biosynthesis
VVHVEETLTAGEMAALYGLCDASVALHRAEGWGLPLSEAMGQGKPVIATGWSGNTDFMTAANSYPVPYSLVSPRRTMVPGTSWFRLYPADTLWAQPNHGEAVACMLEVARHGLSADRAANLGPSLEQFSPAAIGRRLAVLLEEVAR